MNKQNQIYDDALEDYSAVHGGWPKPHTSTWHELHMLYNMQQAMHTMQIITASDGETNICGICGDAPAFDYITQGTPQDREFPVRWCEDCRDIQMGWGVRCRVPEPGEIT